MILDSAVACDFAVACCCSVAAAVAVAAADTFRMQGQGTASAIS